MECCGHEAKVERVYRFGVTPVMESPFKRRKQNPPTRSSPEPELYRSPRRSNLSRWSSRPGSPQTRWTGSPCSSRRSRQWTPSARTAHHVVHPPRTIKYTSSQAPVIRREDLLHPHHLHPLEGPGHEHGHGPPIHHQLHQVQPKNKNMNTNVKMLNVKQLIEEMNTQNIQDNHNIKKKKKKEDIDEHEENVQKKVQMSSTSTSTYLQRPGPGTRASSRRLATPGWQQKVGDQSSSSSSSPVNHTTFASIQLNTMAGGTPGKGVILIGSLGSVIAANSCSTAADISATVLAGNFEISKITVHREGRQ